jgi:hypothetical protein
MDSQNGERFAGNSGCFGQVNAGLLKRAVLGRMFSLITELPFGAR